MIKRLLICCIIFIFPFFLISEEYEYCILQPKITTYTKAKEKILLNKGYTKVSEDQFDGIKLFKEIYKTVYGQDYTKFIPDYCVNNFYSQDIYYAMFNSLDKKSEPCLMTFAILQKKDVKYFYYKLNYNLDYEIYIWEPDDPAKKEEMKIFY